MRNKRKCPSCGRQIYQYAQICPYCKGETHFSSFDEEMPQEEIEITKSIGNTFAIGIKNILESFLDRELREDIKHHCRQ